MSDHERAGAVLYAKGVARVSAFYVGIAVAWLIAGSAGAAEIKVLTAGAFKPVVMALVPEFERQTGHKLTVENDTADALVRRIGNGETFDVVVLTPDGMAPLAGAGKVDSEILAVPGAALVGPIPAEIQNYTVYVGGVSMAARDGPAAQAFLALLGSARARDVLRDKRMEAP